MSVSSGCQLQVSLRGAQDVYLMSPKDDSFFRTEYRRHTNFASGESEQSTQTTSSLGRRNIQTTVSRSGDLLGQCYLNAHFSPWIANSSSATTFGFTTYTGWVNGLGYAMIDEIVCLIGNKDFDTQDGEFMFQREQVSAKSDRKLGRAVHFYEGIGGMGPGDFIAAQNSLRPVDLYIPLQFWFCNYVEQCLPVIGLYWHEIQLNLSLKPRADLVNVVGSQAGFVWDQVGDLEDLQYLCNFHYLDRPERALFANQKLEQVFIQHQTLGTESWTSGLNQKEINVRMNHPITDMMFAPRLTSRTGNGAGTVNQWFNYNGNSWNPINMAGAATFAAETFDTCQIFFNNTQRTLPLSAEFLRQIPQHRAQERISPELFFRVYGYNFGIRVNEILATGTANFSRYDSAQFRFVLWPTAAPAWSNATWANAATVVIHARNFQLNKTSIGMCGIKFAA